MINREKP